MSEGLILFLVSFAAGRARLFFLRTGGVVLALGFSGLLLLLCHRFALVRSVLIVLVILVFLIGHGFGFHCYGGIIPFNTCGAQNMDYIQPSGAK